VSEPPDTPDSHGDFDDAAFGHEAGDAGESDEAEETDYETGDGEADDIESEGDDVAHTALPPKVEAWRKRSATGAILTGFALGLQQALETKRDEPGIVVQTSGDPPGDLPVEADFEYGRPRQSVVNIRPWLLEKNDAENGHAGDSADDENPPEEPDK
jgi:hypothetical protein